MHIDSLRQGLIKAEEMRLNQYEKLVLAQMMCVWRQKHLRLCTGHQCVCVSESVMRNCVWGCVCVWLRLHIYECFFFPVCLTTPCSLKLIYCVMQLVWYPSGWLMCHSISLVLSLPLCLKHHCSLSFFPPKHDFCIDALPVLDNNSASISCTVAGLVS